MYSICKHIKQSSDLQLHAKQKKKKKEKRKKNKQNTKKLYLILFKYYKCKPTVKHKSMHIYQKKSFIFF